jgi:hypothetical protein
MHYSSRAGFHLGFLSGATITVKEGVRTVAILSSATNNIVLVNLLILGELGACTPRICLFSFSMSETVSDGFRDLAFRVGENPVSDISTDSPHF